MASVHLSDTIDRTFEATWPAGGIGFIVASVLVGGIMAYWSRDAPVIWRVGETFLAGALSGAAVGFVAWLVAVMSRFE